MRSVGKDKLGRSSTQLGAEALDIPNISLREHWRDHFVGMAVEAAYALALLAAGGVMAWAVVTIVNAGAR